jgi:hypothetical protein
MLYRLHEDLSYCQIDGHLIFLDLGKDRYFRLSDRLERVFLTYLKGNAQADLEVGDLVHRNILVPTPDETRRTQAQPIALPSRSALEANPTASKPDARVLLEVFAIVCSTQWRLKTQPLKHLINALVDYQRRMKATVLSTRNEATVLEAVSIFRQARPYVPIETCCLLDSVSLVQYLARRRVHAHMVIGVTCDPFAAHCWVQTRDWVLNDTVGNVIAHTPILEV